MLSLFLLACTELKPAVPDLEVATDPSSLSPATSPATDDLDALLDQHVEALCDAYAECADPSSGLSTQEQLGWAQTWELVCGPDAQRPTPACDDPDLDALRDCVEGEFSCDGGLHLPDRCQEICPEDEEVVPPTCGSVVGTPGWTSEQFYRAPLRFELTTADPTTTVTVTQNGTPVSGSLTWDDHLLGFHPSQPFTPNASLHVEVTTCSGDNEQSFDTTVSAYGQPMQASASGAYRIDLSEGTFIEPAGVGALLTDMLERPVFLGVDDQGGSIETMLVEGTQAAPTCSGPVASTSSSFAQSPFFEASYPEVYLPYGDLGDGAWIEDVTLSGAFDAAGTSIGGLTLTGTVDTRGLLAGSDCTSFLGAFGVDCEPCPDGAQACVPLTIADLDATYEWWVLGLEDDFLGACE